MDVRHLINSATKKVQKNSPLLLTALGVSGVLTTSYLVARATYEASGIIRDNEASEGIKDDPKERLKERTKQVWRLYIPAGVSGAATIACIVGSSKINGRRVSAAYAAYSLSDLAFNEYKEKVVEQIGKNKEQAIRDEIAQDKVAAIPSEQGQLFVISGTQVLCCESYTGRYFRSDMETLRKAENDINMKIMNELYVTLDEFYHMVGLVGTTHSSGLGWNSDKLMKLEFSTVLAPGNEPCLAFEYNYVKPLK